ncbi:MAG TPA: enoyl-CoA hydratase-related protein [Acidimicrobiales bacterium]|jgi:enoyl-CoA hydratase/carnithine racemase
MPISATDTLSYEVRRRTAYVTMNRPRSMNALNGELTRALAEAFVEADGDDEVLVVVLGGAGGRAFSAGGDLKEASDTIGGDRDPAAADGTGDSGAPRPARRRSTAISAYPAVAKGGSMPGFDQVNQCSKPVIAAIDGYCLGGGLELALYCDIRLATRQSTFALPEPKRNLLSGPAFVHLSRMIPLGEAMRMELTGEPLDSQRAYQIGLIQGLSEDREGLDAAVEKTADQLSENSPLAVQFLKRIVKDGRDMTVEQHWKFAEMFAYTLGRTEDALEGPRAFVEKRKPDWKMR